jgi:3-hydroxyisobutyrate dehydrogenase-like beta-hydroxyacid dehydrogenase
MFWSNADATSNGQAVVAQTAEEADAATTRHDHRQARQLRRSKDCPTPLFATATQFYHAGVAQGRGGHDTGAVCAVLEQLAGIAPRG